MTLKYQLTCPKCKHEFAYDADYYDKNIARLGMEIKEITVQLQKHKMLPKSVQKARTDWWLRAKKVLAEKQEELAGLKAIRKVADQQIKFAEYSIFREMFKEKYGEQAYFEMIAKVHAEMEAYKVSGMMWHEYSRSNAKSSVTSINKL